MNNFDILSNDNGKSVEYFDQQIVALQAINNIFIIFYIFFHQKEKKKGNNIQKHLKQDRFTTCSCVAARPKLISSSCLRSSTTEASGRNNDYLPLLHFFTLFSIFPPFEENRWKKMGKHWKRLFWPVSSIPSTHSPVKIHNKSAYTGLYQSCCYFILSCLFVYPLIYIWRCLFSLVGIFLFIYLTRM